VVDEDDGKASPKNLTLLDMLREFIQHRLKVIMRRSQYELKARRRPAAYPGRPAQGAEQDRRGDRHHPQVERHEAARANLMKRFKLSEVQAQAILDMPLRRLAALERKKLEDERSELTSRVKDLKEILASEERRLAVVAEETLEIKARFATRGVR
jgi:DNA gyrase subunit A